MLYDDIVPTTAPIQDYLLKEAIINEQLVYLTKTFICVLYETLVGQCGHCDIIADPAYNIKFPTQAYKSTSFSLLRPGPRQLLSTYPYCAITIFTHVL